MQAHSSSVSSLFGFISAWFATRSFRQLVPAIPAIVLSMIVFGAFLVRPFLSTNSKIYRYEKSLVESAASQDYDAAFMCLYKLQQLDAVNEEMAFKLALMSMQQGEANRGLAEIVRLAPLDHPGYAPAHVWQIKALLSGMLTKDKHLAVRQAEQHLDRLIELSPDDPAILVQKALFLAQTERIQKGRDILQPLMAEYPNLRLVDAQMAALQTGVGAGKASLEETVGVLESTREKRELTLEEYATLLEAYRVLEDKLSVEQTAAELQESFAGNQQAKQVVSGVYARMAQASPTAGLEDKLGLVELLEKSLAANALNASSLRRLIAVSREDSDAGAEAAKLIDDLRESDKTPAATRFAVGSEKAAQGKYEQALADLQRVVNEEPNSAVAWNNLAYVLGKLGDDLQRAKTCADKAIELSPEDLRFWETRGQIHLKLEMRREALVDFEKASPAYKDDEGFQESLEQLRRHDATRRK